MSGDGDAVTPAHQLAEALHRLEAIVAAVKSRMPGVDVTAENAAEVVGNALASAAQIQASNEILSAACEGYQARLARVTQGR